MDMVEGPHWGASIVECTCCCRCSVVTATQCMCLCGRGASTAWLGDSQVVFACLEHGAGIGMAHDHVCSRQLWMRVPHVWVSRGRAEQLFSSSLWCSNWVLKSCLGASHVQHPGHVRVIYICVNGKVVWCPGCTSRCHSTE